MTVVFTPHNVHVEGAFAVVTSATLAGSLDELPIELECHVDRELAAGVLDGAARGRASRVGVSYGSNDESLAAMPLDWGTLIPLWFLGGRREEPRPVVVVSPARDLPLADHVRAGAAVAGRVLREACGDRRERRSRSRARSRRTVRVRPGRR